MLSLLESFALGMAPVVVIAAMILGGMEPERRRRLLRHPVTETRSRFAGDEDGDD